MRLQDLAGIAIIFVVVAIVISIGADVLTEVQVGKTVSTVEYNASQYGLEGLEELASWLPTIAIIIAAAIIIGLIFVYFKVR